MAVGLLTATGGRISCGSTCCTSIPLSPIRCAAVSIMPRHLSVSITKHYNAGGSKHGVMTNRPGALSNDFFINWLECAPRGRLRRRPRMCLKHAMRQRANWNGPAPGWTSCSARTLWLRAIAEVYASSDEQAKIVQDLLPLGTRS